MDHLEKILTNLPRVKLRRLAAFKLRLTLYRLSLSAYFKNFTAYWRQALIWQRGLAVAVLVLAVLGGTSAYAYASDAVVPGNPIYPLKIAVEQIEKAVAVTPAAKVAVYEKISSRRLKEAADLGEAQSKATTTVNVKVSNNITASINAALSSHQAAVETIDDLGNHQETLASQAKFQARTEDKNEERAGYLDQIESYAQSSQDLKVMEKVNEASRVINRGQYKKETENDHDARNKKNEDNQVNDSPAITPTSSSTSTLDLKISAPSPANILPPLIFENNGHDKLEVNDERHDDKRFEDKQSDNQENNNLDLRGFIKKDD